MIGESGSQPAVAAVPARGRGHGELEGVFVAMVVGSTPRRTPICLAYTWAMVASLPTREMSIDCELPATSGTRTSSTRSPATSSSSGVLTGSALSNWRDALRCLHTGSTGPASFHSTAPAGSTSERSNSPTGNRTSRPSTPRSRSHPFGRQSPHQQGHGSQAIRNEGLSLPPLHVHECLDRHSWDLHWSPRRARSPLDPDNARRRRRVPSRRRCLPRHLCRSQELTDTITGQPEWPNWQRRWSQTPLGETPCGFESHLRHKSHRFAKPHPMLLRATVTSRPSFAASPTPPLPGSG